MKTKITSQVIKAVNNLKSSYFMNECFFRCSQCSQYKNQKMSIFFILNYNMCTLRLITWLISK